MKKVKFLTASILTSGVLLLACQKERGVINPNCITQTSENETGLNKSVNPYQNPYEFVGEIHNIALAAVIEHPNYGNLTVDEIFDICRTTVRKEMLARGMKVNSALPELTDELRADLESTKPAKELWDEMLGEMHNNERQIMRSFEQEIDNFLIHRNYGLTIANMKRLENQADKNPKIEDKVMLTSMLSLSRNSFAFWHKLDVENGNDMLFTANGKWRADIKEFRKDWKQHSNNPTWGFSERWDSATTAGSAASSIY